jgi:hypothetical protein
VNRLDPTVHVTTLCAKDNGLENFPFHDFLPNQLWLELVLAAQDASAFFQRLCLLGAAQNWDPNEGVVQDRRPAPVALDEDGTGGLVP